MEHSNIPVNEIHVPHNWAYADSAERLAAVHTDVRDVDKLALQRSDGSYWRLTGVSPATWASVRATSTDFEQVFSSAASIWTVNHNLGYRPNVQVLTLGGLEIEALVQHTSVNQAVVHFSSAQTGRVRCI